MVNATIHELVFVDCEFSERLFNLFHELFNFTWLASNHKYLGLSGRILVRKP